MSAVETGWGIGSDFRGMRASEATTDKRAKARMPHFGENNVDGVRQGVTIRY